MQNAGICQDECPRRDKDIYLIRMIAEHNRVVLFNKSSPLFVGWNQLIVQRNAIEMGAGDNFETAVFNRCIGQVVGQKHGLWPGRTAHWIIP